MNDDARELLLPLTETDVRSMRVGDSAVLSGRLFTGRDAIHKYLAAGNPPPCNLTDAVLYHCGPVVTPAGDGWSITAAGPTTSVREEPYMADLIRKFHLRGIIGKGGMGARTLQACQDCGCMYMHAVGGAAQVLAECITRVAGVYLEDHFGSPEALWELEVSKFPVIVTMDAYGKSLHADVESKSHEQLEQLLT